MNIKIGEKFLLTTHNWFFAGDGQEYRAVFGTVKGIHGDKETLGLSTNRHSTNWYIEIGNMIVAGCQIFYAIQTDEVSLSPGITEATHEGKAVTSKAGMSRIYDADAM